MRDDFSFYLCALTLLLAYVIVLATVTPRFEAIEKRITALEARK